MLCDQRFLPLKKTYAYLGKESCVVLCENKNLIAVGVGGGGKPFTLGRTGEAFFAATFTCVTVKVGTRSPLPQAAL